MPRSRARWLLAASLALAAACAAPSVAPGRGAPSGAPAAPAAASAPAPPTPAASVPAAPTAPAAPVGLKVDTHRLTGDGPMYVALEKGYFREQGLDVELVDTGAGTEPIAHLAVGQLDVGVGSVGPAMFNAANRGVDIRMVADKGAIGPDPSSGFPGSQALVLAPDLVTSGRVREIKDLRGLTFALVSRGQSLDLLLDRALQQGGLTNDDVTVETIPHADTLAALANRRVDGAITLEPFIAQGEALGVLTRWKRGVDIYPGQQLAVVMFGPHLTEIGQQAGDRFMVAYTRALRDYNDAFGPTRKNHAEIVSILMQYTVVKEAGLYDRMAWPYINPNCSLNVAAMAADLDWYVARQLVPEKPDMARLVDDSYCQRAVAQLGRYQP